MSISSVSLSSKNKTERKKAIRYTVIFKYFETSLYVWPRINFEQLCGLRSTFGDCHEFNFSPNTINIASLNFCIFGFP